MVSSSIKWWAGAVLLATVSAPEVHAAVWRITPASAAGELDRTALYAQAGPSREQIIDDLQRRYNARVVRVDEMKVDGRDVLEVRLLSDQKVWTVRVDATTGQELPRS